MGARGPKPKYDNKGLKIAFKKYRAARKKLKMPLTLESLFVGLEISNSCWYKYKEEREDLHETMEMIYTEIVSSLVDFGLAEKSKISMDLLSSRDRELYGNKTQATVEGTMAIVFKPAQKR